MVAPPLATSSAVTPVTCSKAGRRAQLAPGTHLTMLPFTVAQRLLVSNAIGPLSTRIAVALAIAPAALAVGPRVRFADGSRNLHSVQRSVLSCCAQIRPSWERSNQPHGL